MFLLDVEIFTVYFIVSSYPPGKERRRGGVAATFRNTSQWRHIDVLNETLNDVSMVRHQDVSLVRLHDVIEERRDDV